MAAEQDPTLISWLFSPKKKAVSETLQTETKELPFLKNNWLVFGLLALLVVIVYANSLGNDLVSDDKGLIDLGARQLSLGYIFSDPFSFIHSVIFAFAYLLFGTNALVLRLINIIFHTGNSFLVFLIIKKLFNLRVAFFSALIFAVHPLLTEAVSWISGGPYSQYSFFFLGSFLAYISFSEGKAKKYYYWAVGIYLLGLLESNRVLALAPLFLLYEYGWGDLKRKWPYLVPFFGLSFLWGLIYYFQIGVRSVDLPQLTYSTGGLYNPFLQVPYAVWTYLKLIFWPQDLSFYQSAYVPSLGVALFRVLVVGCYLLMMGLAFLKNKKIFFLLAFFLISLAITLTPLKIASPVAERYAYLGSIGLIVLVAYCLDKLAREKNWSGGVYILVILIVSLLGIRTIMRNFDWKNTDVLALSTVKTTPSSPRAHNLAGAYYFKTGDYTKAAQEFQATVNLNPGFADAYHNLAVVYSKAGKYDEAIKLDLKAISLNKNLPQAYVSLTTSYLKKGDKESAQKVLIVLQKAAPNDPTVQALLKEAQAN